MTVSRGRAAVDWKGKVSRANSFKKYSSAGGESAAARREAYDVKDCLLYFKIRETQTCK